MSEDQRNKIQIELSGDEAELVVGEIYGLRQWQIHDPVSNPYLVGHYSAQWDLYGPNIAQCTKTYQWVSRTFSLKPQDFEFSGISPGKAVAFHVAAFFRDNPLLLSVELALHGSGYPTAKQTILRTHVLGPELPTLDLLWPIQAANSTWWVDRVQRSKNVPLDFRLNAKNPIMPHSVTLPSCTCGFYAYTDERSLRVNSRTYGDLVFGLIRAYGLVTQGTKGFRAQKAEVVALTRPQSAVNTGEDNGSYSFGPYYYKWVRPQHRATWIVNEDEIINDGFRRMVPDTIAVLDTLDDLLTLSNHFLEPPEDQ